MRIQVLRYGCSDSNSVRTGQKRIAIEMEGKNIEQTR